MNATYRQSFGLVEKRGRRVMLTLSVLNNELLARPISIYRQTNASTALARVAHEPLETMLPRRQGSKDSVTKIDDIRLVAIDPLASTGAPTHSDAPEEPRAHPKRRLRKRATHAFHVAPSAIATTTNHIQGWLAAA